ncbi:two-component response regulator [Croceibacterium mercuriale]|uniref:Two-component response regulator n=1 Tax=Croceibacterium mercuriale TaxID=1572751 RepID=A0A0B2BXK6_9SPHN|nr:response regulator [Croceibacterium mercuriale]KHL24416.1 two-component response regulator [Croceibacterium mercuriale]
MSIGAEVAAHLPFLRRYARALTGSQSTGDAFVQATLEAALADEDLAQSLSGGRVPLYAAFNKVWSSAYMEIGEESAGGLHERAAQDQLKKITPINRQALLLTTVEDFSAAEAAEIMGVSADDVSRLVADAVEEIERESTTSVLIIEDEPLISMQLEDLVRSLGHDICGTAATRTQAQEVVAEKTPGLVLADIQLADGSSGLDAVDDILQSVSVPVIFITAYPERLLTGDRTEPTYLITKPFHEDTVRAAISQALFFGSARPLG